MNPIYTKTVLDNLDWLQAKIDQGATFFVGHSGGKDSQALAAVIESLVPADQIVYVHADLGNVEWPGIKKHIASNLPAGKTLEVVEAIYADGTPKGLLDRIERNHERLVGLGKTTNPWPDNSARFCTGELKTDVIWKLIRNWPGCTVAVNCVGIRGEESTRRAKLDPLKTNKKNDNSKREAWDWYPIFDLTLDDVWKIIADSGQTRHPAYDNGNDRLSCMFCVFGSVNDWRNGAKANPDLYRRYVQMEKDFGFTIRRNKPIEDWVGLRVSDLK